MLKTLVCNACTVIKRQMGLTSHLQGKCQSNDVANTVLDLEVNRIVWIDLEMTGLDVDKDKIMEIACLITDANLNIIAEGPDIVIHHPENALRNMSEWCIHHHGKTGLTDASLQSKVTVEEAENTILEFVDKYVTERTSPLAGNSVYTDRLFLMKCMPRLNSFLHYRIIDVSSIKEVCRRWNPELYKMVPKKVFAHRALSDIKESVKEMRFYKENFFKTTVDSTAENVM